ncbi:hypothetical protein [Bradyrhizobium sp. AZCC 2289]|uniref:hypothetical protein n=1 Tax=Bradyrhizobium sp. AZCC 2289 TaxID=3117026 RepID=UPI002FEEB259
MAEYKLTTSDAVIRTIDNTIIPNHPDNADWIEYLQWLADGGVPDPLPPKIDPELDSMGTGKTANQILGAT